MTVKQQLCNLVGFGRPGPRFYIFTASLQVAIPAMAWVISSLYLGLPIF